MHLVACGEHIPTGSEWTSVPNSFAKHFQVLVRGAERMVIVFGPGGNADTTGVYIVRAMGEERPEVHGTHIPALDRVAVVSSTHLAYLSALNSAEKVVGIVGAERVRDPLALRLIGSGAIAEIGAADGIDRERLLATRAQALFDYPFGRASRQASVHGIGRVEVTEYLEEHPLGRAEWVRFFGVLLDREREADSLFDAIAERYERASQVAGLDGHRPVVFFGSHWQGDWHVPPGNSYMATLIKDAGGEYCFADRTAQGNIPVDLETVITQGGKAERFGVVLESGGVLTAEVIAGGDPRVASLPVIAVAGFALDSERGDIFGQALLEPDVMLEELVCRMHPGKCAIEAPKYVFAVGQ